MAKRIKVAETEDAKDDRLINAWLENYETETKRNYSRYIEDFRNDIGINLKYVTEDIISEYLQRLDSEAIARCSLAAIRSLYNFSLNVNYVDTNPAINVVYKSPDRQLNSLSEQQVNLLLNKASTTRDQLILNFIYYMAMTSEEISNAKWQDLIEEDRLFLRISGEYKRTVPIPEHLHAALQQLQIKAKPNEHIFLSRFNGGVSVRQVNRIVHNVAKLAKLANVHPFLLRTSHAAHALQHGATVDEIVAALGISFKTASAYFQKFAIKTKRYTIDLLIS